MSGERLATPPSPHREAAVGFLSFRDLHMTGIPLSEIITFQFLDTSATRIESFMKEVPLENLRRTDTPSPTSDEAKWETAISNRKRTG